MMTSYTASDQMDFDRVLAARDDRLHIDRRHKAEIRKDIVVPEIDPRKKKLPMSFLFFFFFPFWLELPHLFLVEGANVRAGMFYFVCVFVVIVVDQAWKKGGDVNLNRV